MKRLLMLIVLSLFALLLFSPSYAQKKMGGIAIDIIKKHELFLYPIIRVFAGNAAGSGVLIYSKEDPDNKNEFISLVLTCHHVVEGLIKYKKDWDSMIKKNVEKEFLEKGNIEIFEYVRMSKVDSTKRYAADVLAYDKNHDLVILRINSPKKFDHWSKLIPKDDIKELKLFTDVVVSGCFSGNTCVITNKGKKKISRIKIGDEVLTHTGKYQKVTNVITRKYNDVWYSLDVGGDTSRIRATKEHPILTQRGWIPISLITTNDEVFFAASKCKICAQPIPYFRTICNYCNPYQLPEVRAKLQPMCVEREAKRWAKQREMKKQIPRGWGGGHGNFKHWREDILPEAKRLEEQGFRVLPLGNYKVYPDIIAIRDNKVFAVEVEKINRCQTNSINYDKYKPVQQYFDDIIWILKKKEKSKHLQGIEYRVVDENTVAIKVKKAINLGKRATKQVWNLSVENDESYVLTSGILVHNCSLAHEPFCNFGQITFLNEIIEQKTFLMSNANSIFGNSGGALFLSENGQLIGITARITGIQLGFGFDIMTWMGFSIHPERIYEFIDEQELKFIYDEKDTFKVAMERREKKKQEALMSIKAEFIKDQEIKK